MKFKSAYKKYVIEAASCKSKRKAKNKSLKEQCGAPPVMTMITARQGCDSDQNQMIVNNLMRIKEHSEYIAQYTQSSGQSEEWVQEKIAAIAREIDNIYHYTQGEQNKMQSSDCSGTPSMQPIMVMGDKPGAAPVGTYVFSTEKAR